MRNAAENRQLRRGLAAWAKLVAGAALLAGTVMVLVQGYAPPGLLGSVIRNNLRQGIDATALFYTETEASSEAEALIRDALWLSVDRNDGSAALPRNGIDGPPRKGALIEDDDPVLEKG